jgi:excisionase family DNA binding protein
MGPDLEVPACLWNERQAAKYLNCSVEFLQADRVRAKTIPFIKLGRAVRYDPVDVKAYAESRKVRGSPAAGAAL